LTPGTPKLFICLTAYYKQYSAYRFLSSSLLGRLHRNVTGAHSTGSNLESDQFLRSFISNVHIYQTDERIRLQC